MNAEFWFDLAEKALGLVAFVGLLWAFWQAGSLDDHIP